MSIVVTINVMGEILQTPFDINHLGLVNELQKHVYFIQEDFT